MCAMHSVHHVCKCVQSVAICAACVQSGVRTKGFNGDSYKSMATPVNTYIDIE
jgi:hypothetical protein